MSTTLPYVESHLGLHRWLHDLAHLQCTTLTLPLRIAKAADSARRLIRLVLAVAVAAAAMTRACKLTSGLMRRAMGIRLPRRRRRLAMLGEGSHADRLDGNGFSYFSVLCISYPISSLLPLDFFVNCKTWVCWTRGFLGLFCLVSSILVYLFFSLAMCVPATS
jgi:hypothetical protein